MARKIAADILTPGEFPFHREVALPLRVLSGIGRFAARKPLGAFGALIIFLMILAAALTFAGFADNITGYQYDDQVLADRFQDPSWAHKLGTDQTGRDTFSRIFHGSRVSI